MAVVAAIIISMAVLPPSWLIKRIVKVADVAKEQTEEPIRERRMMLDMGWHMLCENPAFGIGMGAFGIAYPSYLVSTHYLSSHLHNQYLQFAAEGGFPAAILFAAAIFLTVFAILKRGKKQKNVILVGIGTGALAYGIHIGLDFDWNFHATSLLFITLLTLGVRIAYGKKIFVLRGGKRLTLAIIALIGFLLSIVISFAGSQFERCGAEGNSRRKDVLLARCTTLNPLSARYWYERAQLYTSRGDNEEAIRTLGKAYKLEPRNPLFQYAYGFMLWKTDHETALEHLNRAIEICPYILPNLQLDFAQKARDAGMDDIAEKILSGITRRFSTNPDTRYTERTAGYRYIVAQAMVDLATMALSRGEFHCADSIFRFAQKLGCPRYKDRIALDWDMDIISPEQTVAEMLDAVNIGDTLRGNIYFADSARARLSPGNEIFLMQVLDVKQNMLDEKASVDILMARIEGKHTFWQMGFFNLILEEDGWKIQMKY